MLQDLLFEGMNGSFAEKFVFAVKGKGNFRKDFYPQYKSNRKPVDDLTKAKLVATHKVMLEQYDAVMADGMEADDLVRIWAEEARQQSCPFVIIAEDKDLKCIPGPHYNPKKMLHFHVSEDDADMLYHSQLLAGDPTDGIPGLWRVGLKTAQNKMLKDVPMGERMERVVEVYKEKHEEEWEEKLVETGTLIHILRSRDDSFNKVMEDYHVSTIPV